MKKLNFAKDKMNVTGVHTQSARDRSMAELDVGVRECYADVRELLVHFRTRTNTENIEQALQETLQKFEHQTGLPARLEVHGDGLPLPADVQVQVLHVVQEALSNARKHAGASHVALEVRKGQRLEDVECEELRDATTNEIVVTRLDTGEQIREAPEEEDGQQKLLPGPAPKKKAKPAPAMPKGGAGGIDPKGGDKGRARRRRS